MHKILWTAERVARYLDLIAPLAYRYAEPLPPFHLAILDGISAAIQANCDQ